MIIKVVEIMQDEAKIDYSLQSSLSQIWEITRPKRIFDMHIYLNRQQVILSMKDQFL